MPEVPAQFLQKSVLFLGYRKGGFEPAGTAFYLSSPETWEPTAWPPQQLPSYPDDPGRFTWLVTASHVIEGIDREGEGGKVLLSVNEKGGNRADPYPEVAASDWIKLPSETETGYRVDLALLPFVRPDGYDLAPIPIEACATPSRIQHAGIGPGHEIVYPGLYYEHQGRHRNVPLLRVGTIAALADHDEPVYIRQVMSEAFAHIAEVRSHRGVSGSPVFVALPPVRPMRGDTAQGTFIRMSTRSQFFLLGVMLAHWELQPSDDDKAEAINLGLAVVLDSSYLIEGVRMATEDDKAVRPPSE